MVLDPLGFKPSEPSGPGTIRPRVPGPKGGYEQRSVAIELDQPIVMPCAVRERVSEDRRPFHDPDPVSPEYVHPEFSPSRTVIRVSPGSSGLSLPQIQSVRFSQVGDPISVMSLSVLWSR